MRMKPGAHLFIHKLLGAHPTQKASGYRSGEAAAPGGGGGGATGATARRALSDMMGGALIAARDEAAELAAARPAWMDGNPQVGQGANGIVMKSLRAAC